jgi:hypothetical protein
MRNEQSGISLIGLIAILFIVIVVALFAMKVVPSFMEYRAAKNIIEQVAKQVQAPTEVRRAFESRAVIDDIKSIKAADLDVQREGNQVVIAFAYEKRIPLFGPVSLIIDYAADSRGGQ